MIRGALLVIVSIVGFVFCLKHGLIDRHFDATHGRWSRPAMDGSPFQGLTEPLDNS